MSAWILAPIANSNPAIFPAPKGIKELWQVSQADKSLDSFIIFSVNAII